VTDPDTTPPHGIPIMLGAHVPDTAPVRPGIHIDSPDDDVERLRSLQDMTVQQSINAARRLIRDTPSRHAAANDAAAPMILAGLRDAETILMTRPDEASLRELAVVRMLMHWRMA
jgi:hypothetical protein